MMDCFNNDSDRQRFFEILRELDGLVTRPDGTTIEHLDLDQRIRFDKLCAEAHSLVWYVSVSASMKWYKDGVKIVHNHWSACRPEAEALFDQLLQVFGSDGIERVTDHGKRRITSKRARDIFAGSESDLEFFQWLDRPAETMIHQRIWPSELTVDRSFMYGESDFSISVPGRDLDWVDRTLSMLDPLLNKFFVYSTELVNGMRPYEGPQRRMSGFKHSHRITRVGAREGWVPWNLGLRMKVPEDAPWCGGQNRELLEQWYEIDAVEGFLYFRSRDESRMPGWRQWIALDRYKDYPERFREQHFSFADQADELIAKEYRPDDPRFNLRYGEVTSETFPVSVVCRGVDNNITRLVDDWAEYVMNLDEPGVAYLSAPVWEEWEDDSGLEDETGLSAYVFICDLGGGGEHPQSGYFWVERLLFCLFPSTYVVEVVIGEP